jgi:hypothetical protein
MSPKPTVRLDFCDFNGIDKNDNFFTRILSREYRVEINDRPDLIIYSKESHLHRMYTCKKLFWTGETIRPDFSICDYAMTCYHIDDPRHLRFPYYVVGSGCRPEELLKAPGEVETVASSGRKFCSFVISNANPKRAGRRLDFFRRLGRYKPWIPEKGAEQRQEGDPPGQAKYDHPVQVQPVSNKSIGECDGEAGQAMWGASRSTGNRRWPRDSTLTRFLSLNGYRTEEFQAIVEIGQDGAKYRPCGAVLPGNRVGKYYDETGCLRSSRDPRIRPPGRSSAPLLALGRWRLAKRIHGTSGIRKIERSGAIVADLLVNVVGRLSRGRPGTAAASPASAACRGRR